MHAFGMCITHDSIMGTANYALDDNSLDQRKDRALLAQRSLPCFVENTIVGLIVMIAVSTSKKVEQIRRTKQHISPPLTMITCLKPTQQMSGNATQNDSGLMVFIEGEPRDQRSSLDVQTKTGDNQN